MSNSNPACRSSRNSTCVQVVALVQVLCQGGVRICPAPEVMRLAVDFLGPLAVWVGEQRKLWIGFSRLFGHRCGASSRLFGIGAGIGYLPPHRIVPET